MSPNSGSPNSGSPNSVARTPALTSRAPARIVDRSFYEADSLEVAPKGLDKVLAIRNRRGRVSSPAASSRSRHTGARTTLRRTPTRARPAATRHVRPARTLYIYFTYGMHWCANLVCRQRASPKRFCSGRWRRSRGRHEVGESSRGARMADRDLLSGPARLCKGLGIDGTLDGADLVEGDMGLVLFDDGVAAPEHPESRAG